MTDLERLTETARTTATIIDPTLHGPHFTGTSGEAVNALVDYATALVDVHGPGEARTRLARTLVNAQHDRVAEVYAATLMDLVGVPVFSRPLRLHGASEIRPGDQIDLLSTGDWSTVTAVHNSQEHGCPSPGDCEDDGQCATALTVTNGLHQPDVWHIGEDDGVIARVPAGPGTTAASPTVHVLTWDWKDQPDLAELARIVASLSGGTVHITNVEDTGSDEYAVVIANRHYSQTEATDAYLNRSDDTAPCGSPRFTERHIYDPDRSGEGEWELCDKPADDPIHGDRPLDDYPDEPA